MEYEKIKIYQDKLFQTKNREQWDSVCTEIKELTEGDEQARTVLRNYLSKIKDKKFQYFETYPPKDKKQFPIKNSHIFQDDLASALAEYIRVLTIEKKQQLNLI